MNGYGHGFENMGGNMGGFSPSYYNSEVFQGAVSWLLFCFGLFMVLAAVLFVYLTYRILTKAGYSGWLALLAVVPFGFFVILLILAFDTWPTAQAQSLFTPAAVPDPVNRVAKMTFAHPAGAPTGEPASAGAPVVTTDPVAAPEAQVSAPEPVVAPEATPVESPASENE